MHLTFEGGVNKNDTVLNYESDVSSYNAVDRGTPSPLFGRAFRSA